MTTQTSEAPAISWKGLGSRQVSPGECAFRVWAPKASSLSVEISAPVTKTVPLDSEGGGYWYGVIEELAPGARYKYLLDGSRAFPDPASRSQPDGVHEASEVIDENFAWTDGHWHGLPVEEYIIYELHVGTFTPEGTFDSAIQYLPYLKDLGVTAIEIMPVSQFPGSRNWGYDGVFPYAVQSSYGGHAAMKRFVDAAHRHSLAVVLDVVYNHLGPEGNYLGQYGPYFTQKYPTPWGEAINFDGPDSAGVRRFVIENAVYWVRDYHIDGLRLDAVHAIFDESERHVLADMAEAVHATGRDLHRIINVIAESDLNEARLVRAGEFGGYGLDAQWADDFHHALHSILTGEQSGYYLDFGMVQDVAKALGSGFVYSGQYSKYRERYHGTDCADLPGRAFVVCIQNHDQVGNRMMGERLAHLVELDDLKLAAGILLLSPYVPLLFMGQEYGEEAPFLYFVSHSDPNLVQAVREGRKREFAAFAWRGEVPDAQAEETFLRSKLNHGLRERSWHAVLLRWYKSLLSMRKTHPALTGLNRNALEVELLGSGRTLTLRRWSGGSEVLAIYHLSHDAETISVQASEGEWRKVLDSCDAEWLGRGSKLSAETRSNGRLTLDLGPRACVVYSSGS